MLDAAERLWLQISGCERRRPVSPMLVPRGLWYGVPTRHPSGWVAGAHGPPVACEVGDPAETTGCGRVDVDDALVHFDTRKLTELKVGR